MRALLVVVAALLTEVVHAQGVTVSGTVRDSLAGAPLAGAMVQVVADSANAMPRTVIADSAGRYRIDGVGRGRYFISFLHPLLDSLSLEPIYHSLDVVGGAPITYDLGTPSGARLRGVFCPARTAANSGAAFVGVVRDAVTLQPVAGATVVAAWLDVVIGRGGMSAQPASRAMTTGPNGWFALCGVPGPGNLSIHAKRGSDTTDLLDMSMPVSLFVRRDLYVAAPGAKGRLSGRVVNEKGAPMAGAIVRVSGGGQTRSGADGEWILTELPLGTRVLAVRAIGYYPDRRPVDVIADAPSVSVRMVTFESVLDTMQVRASVIAGVDQAGFEQRRRASGSGRFFTEEDIRRRAPTETSDIFRSVPGMSSAGGIKMRSAFTAVGSGSPSECIPNVFLDGRPMPVGGAEDLDSWIRPSEIFSIEVYPDVPPPEFQVALSGCGSIVIWSKRRVPVKKPPA